MKKNIELLSINGKAKIDIYKNSDLIESSVVKNVILNQGKKILINSISSGQKCQICKVSVGDGAFSSSDEAIKLPTKDMKSMYHEVYRKEIESYESNDNYEITYTVSINSLDINRRSFLNLHDPFLNEIGLIISSNEGLEETLFSLLTFSSIPFKNTDGISITIRYTISIG